MISTTLLMLVLTQQQPDLLPDGRRCSDLCAPAASCCALCSVAASKAAEGRLPPPQVQSFVAMVDQCLTASAEAKRRAEARDARTNQVLEDIKRQDLERKQAEAERRAAMDAAAQREREAAANEADQAAARRATARKDPLTVQLALSAAICAETSRRADAMDEIAKEKKYAKLGGVVDKQKLYDLQQEVRAADESLESARTSLRSWKRPALPCGQPEVAAGANCVRALIREEPEAACKGEKHQAIIDVLRPDET